MKLTEAAATIIDLARVIRDYWNRELPKRHPDYPIVNKGEDSGPPPAEEDRLREFLSGLPSELIYRLVLVMYLGQWYYDAENLAEHLAEIKTKWATPKLAIRLMMHNIPLADYLTDGLAKLGRNGIDPDKPFGKPAKARK